MTNLETIQIGDILYSTWGYEQTNVNFYKVVGRTEKNLKIQEIETIRKPNSEFMSYDAIPDEGKSKGKAMLRKIKTCMNREYVRPCDYFSAHKWSGMPVLGTSYA